MCPRSAILAMLLILPGAVPAAEPAATPPPPHPSSASKIMSPRDAATGQATGKRQHVSIRARMYYDQSILLKDGRVFLVNTKTGEVEFGDGTKGNTPPTGETPADGTYFLPDGTPCRVQGGRTLSKLPAPTKTPAKGAGAAGNVSR